MQLHMATKGGSTVSVYFDEVIDFEACAAIRASKKPISKALDLAKKRMGVVTGVYPIPVNALIGL